MTEARHTNRLRKTGLLTCLAIAVASGTALSQEKDFDAYPEQVANYLKRIYDQKQQTLAYREDYRGGFDKWQQNARESLRQKVGLPKIVASVADHQPIVTLDDAEDLGE